MSEPQPRAIVGDAARLPSLRSLLARIHLRVTLFAVGLTGLTVLLAGFATIGAYAERNLMLVAQSAAHAAAPAIVFDDTTAAQEIVTPLLQAGVMSIAVSHEDGRPLSRVVRAAEDSSVARWVADRLFFAAPVEVPVTHLGRRIGSVHVQGEGSAIARYIRAGMIGTIACLLITGLATYLLARRLHTQIIAPLDAVAAVAHSFRREEAFEQRVPAATIREVEALRNDFNALITELADWRQHLRHENEALNHQATHDALTGLPNRAYFERQVAEMITEAQTSHASFVLLYADGDEFKPINDNYGHAAGDAVLVEIGARVRTCLRARDVAARLGGDEFAFLLAAPSGDDAAERVMAEIAARMAEPVQLPDGTTVAISLSIGAAAYPRDGRTLASLIAHADTAMYAIKQRSRSVRQAEG